MIKKVVKNIKEKLSNLKTTYRNIVFWFPFMIKDKDYDYYYIYEILKIKLKKQAHYIKEYGYHDNKMIDFKYMILCHSLINKLQHEYYLTEWLDYFDSEIILRPMDFYDDLVTELDDDIEPKDFFDIKILEKLENLKYYYNKYPLVFKKIRKEIQNEELNYETKKYIASKIAMENHERAKRLLFRILQEKMESWWD